MRLKDLLQYIDVKQVVGEQDIEITNICYDSRKATQGSLFICIQGFKTDGHLYIDDVIKRGASAILVQNDGDYTGATIIKVHNTRKAMAFLASAFYNRPTQALDLIGITGTNGKTSTTYMVKKMLEGVGQKVGLIGTISNWIGNQEIEAVRTTPESLDLQKLFVDMVEAKVNSCVMEVSSHSLDLERVEACDFKIGVFTNLTPDHLDFHKTIENYRNAKKKLFYKTSLYNVVNIDDYHGALIAEEARKLTTPLLTYGVKEDADIKAKEIHISAKGVSYQLITPTFESFVEVGIPGMFTVYNSLAATAVAYGMGLSKEDIEAGLQNIQGVPGRFEAVKEIHSRSVIVDFAHTPDALENALRAGKELTKNRLITVFGCGGDRDTTKRPVMGELAGNYSDITIITSDNPRTEDPMQIIRMIEDGIIKTSGKYIVIEDRTEAIRHALKIASEEDIILIAGKGHETTQIIGTETIPFDDKKVAANIAKEEGIL